MGYIGQPASTGLEIASLFIPCSLVWLLFWIILKPWWRGSIRILKKCWLTNGCSEQHILSPLFFLYLILCSKNQLVALVCLAAALLDSQHLKTTPYMGNTNDFWRSSASEPPPTKPIYLMSLFCFVLFLFFNSLLFWTFTQTPEGNIWGDTN